jgi:hypothetical protein
MYGYVILRNRRILLTQVNPHHHSFSSPSGSIHLKRLYVHQTTSNESQSSLLRSLKMSQNESGRHHRPAKAPKIEAAQASSSSSSSKSRDPGSRRHGGSYKPVRGSPLAGRSGGSSKSLAKARSQSNIPLLPEPRHDHNYITTVYKTKPLRPDFEENPKSPLANYHTSRYGSPVVYDCTQYRSLSGPVFR